MYKTKLVIIAMFTVLLLLIVGCSNSTNNDVNTENISESMKAQTETMIYTLSSFWDDGLIFLDYGAGYTKPADTSYYTFDDQTFWWTYVRQIDLSSDNVDWMINELDSVRFNTDGVYQRQPDITTYGLEMRIIGDDLMAFNSDSTWGVDYDVSFDIANADEDTIDIEGNISYGLEVVMGTFEFEYDFDCSYDDIRILRHPYDFDNYPTSGTITITIHFTTTGDPVNDIPAGSWTISMTLTCSPTGYTGSVTIEGDMYTWNGDWDELSGSQGFVRP